MNSETLDQKLPLEEDLWARAEKCRIDLEMMAGGKPKDRTPKKIESLIEIAQINLESYGRALLETDKDLPEAVECLLLSGAIKKPHLQALLEERLENLRKSNADKDQKELLKISKSLVSLKS